MPWSSGAGGGDVAGLVGVPVGLEERGDAEQSVENEGPAQPACGAGTERRGSGPPPSPVVPAATTIRSSILAAAATTVLASPCPGSPQSYRPPRNLSRHVNGRRLCHRATPWSPRRSLLRPPPPPGRAPGCPAPRLGGLVLGAALTVILVVLCRRVGDPDFWWHMETGSWIINHGRPPQPRALHLHGERQRLGGPGVGQRGARRPDLPRRGLPRLQPRLHRRNPGRLLVHLAPHRPGARARPDRRRLHRRGGRRRRRGLGPPVADDQLRADLPDPLLGRDLPPGPQPPPLPPAPGHGGLGQSPRRLRLRPGRGRARRVHRDRALARLAAGWCPSPPIAAALGGAGGLRGAGPGQPDHHPRLPGRHPDPDQRRAAELHRRVALAELPLGRRARAWS